MAEFEEIVRNVDKDSSRSFSQRLRPANFLFFLSHCTKLVGTVVVYKDIVTIVAANA